MSGYRPFAELGQIVKILKGRDAGGIAVVVEIVDEKFVCIADGDKRKFDQAKRKNIQHLEFMQHISSEVVQSLNEMGRVTNGKLRYAVRSFIQSNDIKQTRKETNCG
ncbi:ribosomal protein L14E/L6E/L27E [Paenibacillus shirakamiensis]|uniref:Ribosomal protein L14E/L6E/L27E n=1 Tax=Paenibacillus shirakamiensis TaxID=1265935 RepID=A0ABS4JLT0_9BACL|nr:KOW domain-containing RNA-binding protein [Paenibacillus shirakamiensis]MBP2002656.1 ribosomal protein L14E/L6E/L27E [Paenibacillus shirakamiensis]